MSDWKPATARDHLERHVWTHPSNYAGFSPDGDYLIAVRARDADCCAESNYFTAFDWLKEVAKPFPEPEEERDWRGDISERSAGWVYDWRARCSMRGWVEYLMVRADAPDDVKDQAGRIVKAIAGYPILDEKDYDRRVKDAVMDYWKDMNMSWRLDTWKRVNEFNDAPDSSYFGIRRDSLPLEDDALYQDLSEGF